MTKIKYYDCRTSGLGSCWWCDSPTNFILDTPKEEIFCCFPCALKHCRNSKIRRKIRSLEAKYRERKERLKFLKKTQGKTIKQQVLGEDAGK